MVKAKFRYGTVVKNKRLLEKYSIILNTKISGVKCEMQLDTGSAFTFLDNKFIKKYRLFEGKVNHYRNHDRTSMDGFFSHIRQVSINIERLGKFCIPKCYIQVSKTSREERKLKVVNKSNLPFAGFLGCDIFVNKIFEINFKTESIIIYSSLQEFISQNDKIDFHPLSVCENTFLFPYSIDNFRGLAIFDTGSSRYTILLKDSLFKRLFNAKINRLPHEDLIRPDFIARIFRYDKIVNLCVDGLKINKKIPVYCPSKFFSNYLFRSYTPDDAILGNALFFDKRIIFDTINKRFRILEN